MSTATLTRFRPDRSTALLWALVLNTELAAVLAYLATAPVSDVDPVLVAVPFVWINVGAWAVLQVDAPDAPRRTRLAAMAVGAAYFVVLGWAGGVFGASHSHVISGGHTHAVTMLPTVDVHWILPPGWGPLLDVSWAGYQAMLFPFKVVGYAALAYLVYATLLDAATRAVTGVVGLFACVSCTWPVLGSFVAAIFGSGSVVAAAATQQPYRVSTLVFLSAVALLVWRPGAD
ncbi:MAG: ABC transporter ATP-binding protein [Halobacteriaceae archaeon]